MNLNFSFRNQNGQFVKHKTILGFFVFKVGGVLATVALEKLIVSTVAYVAEKRAEKLKNEKIAA